MLRCRRGVVVALVLLASAVAAVQAHAAAVTRPSPSPPDFDAVVDDLVEVIVWDDAVANRFDWLIASPKVPTACRTGRAAFPASVALMDCGADYPSPPRRAVAARAFAGPVGGGGSAGGEGGDSPSAVPLVQNLGTTMAYSIDVAPTTVPVPGAFGLFAAAVGGLALCRRWRG